MHYAQFFPKNYESSAVLFKAFLYIFNIISQDLNVARNGITFVGYMNNFGWQNFSIDIETIAMELLQNVYPMRLRGAYMVDAPMIIGVIMKIMKPLMSKKMRDRMFIVTKDEFSSKVKLDQCPAIVGGTFKYNYNNKNKNNDQLKNLDASMSVLSVSPSTGNIDGQGDNTDSKENKSDEKKEETNDESKSKDDGEVGSTHDKEQNTKGSNTDDSTSNSFGVVYHVLVDYQQQMNRVQFDAKTKKWVESK